MATKYPIIKNPRFTNPSKTKLIVTLVDENGKATNAEMVVPEGRAKGVNPIWDRIMEEHDIKKMEKEREDRDRQVMTQRRYEEKKKLAAVENEKMRILFNMKLEFFNLPFAKDLTIEEKAMIRRAPDQLMLHMAMTLVLIKYSERTGTSLLDMFDLMEDAKYSSTAEKIK